MDALRKLAVGELRECSRARPLFRNLRHGFKTAQAAQHRADPKSIDEMAGQWKVKHCLGHKGACYLGSIASRPAPSPPPAHMAVHLQQRQDSNELLMTFT